MMLMLLGILAFGSMDGDTGSAGSNVPNANTHLSCNPNAFNDCVVFRMDIQIPIGKHQSSDGCESR